MEHEQKSNDHISNPMAYHLRARRLQISFTYALTLIENALDVFYPFLIGLAINGLLADDTMSLLPLVIVWFVHIVVAGLRQLYDTRLFAKIFADIAATMSVNLRNLGGDSGEISAQVDMADEYIEFFETQIPMLITIAISLIGSVALLSLFDQISGVIIGGLVIPVGLINWWLARRSISLNETINDLQEKQVDVISRNRPLRIKRHFGRIARWRVHLSNADAASWTGAEIITMIMFVLVLFRISGLPDATVGVIFAGIAYLIRITDDLDRIPDAVQQIGRLIDIRRRIDL